MTIDGCFPVVTAALWRSSSDEFFWNYTQQRVVAPGAAPECEKIAAKNEWLFYDHDVIPLTCTHLGP